MGRTRSQTRTALAVARAARGEEKPTRRSSRVAARPLPSYTAESADGSDSESSASSKDEEEEDEDEEEGEGDDGAAAVAEYERKRLANIQRNLEFMQSMGVSTARMAARTAVGTAKRPAQSAEKMKRFLVPEEPQRKSRRLEGKLAEPQQFQQSAALVDKPKVRRGYFSETVVDKTDERGRDFLNALIKDEGGEREEREEDLQVDATGEAVVPYSLQERDVVKALPDRVYSLAFHPRADRVVVAAGDKLGNLALWSAPPASASLADDSQAPDVVAYRAHLNPVTQLHFSPQDATKLVSSSFDGRVRELDLRGGEFNDLFATSDSTGLTSLALAGGDQLGLFYASCDDGTVCRLDRRESPMKPKAAFFNLHEKKVNTVHCHPTQTFSIATASLDRTVCLWDVRKLRTQDNTPVLTLPHSRSVNCAYFSPTGDHLVSVGQDNYVNVFSSLDAKHEDPHDVQPTLKIPHNNVTGRWLTKLHASWDPKRPQQFALGCMLQPRRLQIFRATHRNPLQELTSDLFGSVHSINVFHPQLDVIVGGNSSGRLSLWRSRRRHRKA